MLTIAEFAAHLRISVRQVERLEMAGLPSIPVGARDKRYDAAVCTAWLQANRAAIAACLSTRRQKAATTLLSASAASAYTDASRRALLRVTPSEPNPN